MDFRCQRIMVKTLKNEVNNAVHNQFCQVSGWIGIEIINLIELH